MVMHLFYVCLLLPLYLISGEFTASVSRTEIPLGESVTLNLTLKEASANGAPSIDALNNAFVINSHQQSSNVAIVNGKVTSSTMWKIILIPQKEGETLIPSISIQTSAGSLSSEPIAIRTIKGAAAVSNATDDNAVILSVDVSTAKPYKNEPIIYTVRLSSKRALANIQTQKLNVDDAIVEVNGEPITFEKVVNGARVNVVEFGYIITPLKAGTLKIPSTVVHGGMLVKRKTRHGSFFDDDYDPFAVMQGFDRLHPFGLATEEKILEIQPAIAGLNPWLPAKSLKIEEIWNASQPLQEGEPFIRSFKISAEGLTSSQLPSLNELLITDKDFKIYADKPEFGDEVKDGSIHSFRKEQYTIIPQQSGTLTLPEISIAWWDVKKSEKAYARIPSRTLQLAPSPNKVLSTKPETVSDEAHTTTAAPQTAVVQNNPLLYVLIAVLAILLFVAVFWGISLQRRVMRQKKTAVVSKDIDNREKYLQYAKPAKQVPKKDKNEKLPDLNPT